MRQARLKVTATINERQEIELLAAGSKINLLRRVSARTINGDVFAAPLLQVRLHG